ncbi:hypothetical protein MCOR34_005041 [Pyricularia oryzae]|nr:hypothetical protein MCOR34_005041 [Pyricularia oryzae]
MSKWRLPKIYRLRRVRAGRPACSTSPKSGVVGCQQCVMAAAADAKRAIAVIVEKKSYRIYLGTYFYAPAVASLQRQAIVD